LKEKHTNFNEHVQYKNIKIKYKQIKNKSPTLCSMTSVSVSQGMPRFFSVSFRAQVLLSGSPSEVTHSFPQNCRDYAEK
jgi:hypothetical protein